MDYFSKLLRLVLQRHTQRFIGVYSKLDRVVQRPLGGEPAGYDLGRIAVHIRGAGGVHAHVQDRIAFGRFTSIFAKKKDLKRIRILYDSSHMDVQCNKVLKDHTGTLFFYFFVVVSQTVTSVIRE